MEGGLSFREIPEKIKRVAKDFKEGLTKIIRYPFAKGFTKKFRETLEKYGENKITNITIGRDPVNRIVQSIVNFISGGQYEQARKLLNYDDIYHLYMIITLDDGTRLRLEKNQIPQFV